MSQRYAERPTDAPPPLRLDDDEVLGRLGYQRVLARRLNPFANFGVAFSVISVPTGLSVLYGYSMGTGGPAVLVWGWLVVGIMTMMVGLSLAEITSAYPTCGALYFFSSRLARRNQRGWAWYTGCLNLVGQIATTASVDFAAATFIGAFASIQWNFVPTKATTFAIFMAVLVVHGLLNTFQIKLVGILTKVSVWWHVAGVFLIVAVLAVKPAQHQSISFVFTHTVNLTGFHSMIYVAAIGLLTSQWTLVGYDGAAHLSEETTGASIAAPRGIVRAIAVSWVVGLALILGMTFAIQNYTAEQGSATGEPVAQIFLDAAGRGLGEAMLLVVIGCIVFCGMVSVTANSRMIFAFAGRDGALPLARLMQKVRPGTATPAPAVWAAIVLSAIMATPALLNATAYTAVTSISTIGLYLAYGLPILLRLLRGNDFDPGPWNLGRYSRPVAAISVAWIAFITIAFIAPEATPITRDNFNYAGVALIAFLLLSGLWYAFAGRRRFEGPVSTVSVQDAAAYDAELA